MAQPLRIAQVSPLIESVPPRQYGGTERVVAFLTDELVEQGHDVTLFATGDSRTRARLVPCAARALRVDPLCADRLAHHVRMIEEVARRAADFDLIHFHVDYLHFSLMRRLGVPHVTTLHGRLDLPDLGPLYRTFADEPLVSISDAQRTPLPFAGWAGTVYHGLPLDLLSFHAGPGRYLAFLGRISPEKGVDRAIEIAKRTGLPLKIAAKVDKVDADYFETRIKPLLADPLVEFVGEIGEAEKDRFLGEAAAMLFPIDWPEPFGLVMIEAMACGTPVVAFARGSVPEVMRDGVSGFVVEDLEAAVRAVPRALVLPRAACRAYFEERFRVARMAEDYVEIYERILAGEVADDEVTRRRAVSSTASGRQPWQGRNKTTTRS
jgi:glycosyltransferase involved in cell wall biosynthesis